MQEYPVLVFYTENGNGLLGPYSDEWIPSEASTLKCADGGGCHGLTCDKKVRQTCEDDDPSYDCFNCDSSDCSDRKAMTLIKEMR